MRVAPLPLVGSVVSLLLIAAPGLAQQNYGWTSAVSGNWNSPGWSLGSTPGVGPPLSADNATIGAAGSAYAVSLTDARGIRDLTVQNGNTTFAIDTTGSLVVNTLLDVKGGATFSHSGVLSFSPGSDLSVHAATAVFNAGASMSGSAEIFVTDPASVLTINSTSNIAAYLNYTRGQINGTGTLTLTGAFDFGMFDGNSLSGITLNVGGGGNWNTTGTPRIGNATVNLTGGTTFWRQNSIRFTDNGALTVGVGAVLRLLDDDSFVVNSGFTPTFTVNGTFQKGSGNSHSIIPETLTTTVGGMGLLDVQAGNLWLRANATNNGEIRVSGTGLLGFDTAATQGGTGLINVTATGTLQSQAGAGNTATVASGSFTNAGVVAVTSGTLKINAAVNMTNHSGTTLTGGTWRATNATLNLDGRTITTIAAGTTVELTGASATITGLTSLTQNNGRLRIVNTTLTLPATLNNAGVVDVQGTLGAPLTVQSGGKVTGRGTVNGSLTVQNGGTVTPGPGPYDTTGTGVLTTGNTTLNGGATYHWELNSWTSNVAGNNFDQIRGLAGAKLNLSGVSSATPIVLKINSLNGTSAGQIAVFDETQANSWVIADFSNGNASGGIQGFAADKFTIDASGFLNLPDSTAFSVSVDANANRLMLIYTPVPEPASVLLVAGLAGAGALGLRRARRT